MSVPVEYYMVLSGLVFIIGLVGVLVRKNLIIILLSIELMLNATNINFVAFSSHFGNLAGQVFVVFRLDGGRRRSGRGPRHYHRPVPPSRQHQRR